MDAKYTHLQDAADALKRQLIRRYGGTPDLLTERATLYPADPYAVDFYLKEEAPVKLKVDVAPDPENADNVLVSASTDEGTFALWMRQKGFVAQSVFMNVKNQPTMQIDKQGFMDIVKAAQTGKWVSAGGVVIDLAASKKLGEAACVITKPRPNPGYGQRGWTLPKGQIDEGETPTQAAIREVQEETGFNARILPGGSLGTFPGSYSVTHYFMMLQTGGSPQTSYEVEAIKSVTLSEAIEIFNSHNNKRDAEVIKKAVAWLAKNPKALGL